VKIIFLNCWYAQAGKTFFDFVGKNSANTDIFGLTEVQPELFSELKKLLPDFQGFYKGGVFDVGMGFKYGQAIFTREKINVKSLGRIDSPKDSDGELGFAFALPFKLIIGRKTFYLMNIHGKSRPGHKLDTPARLKQSKIIIDYFRNKPGARIIGGDFNLLPQTKSVKMFEETGYKNLIKDYKIRSTRNRLAWNQLKKNEEKQLFADYVFVSPEVKVKNFSVPDLEISDHLPLILDFEI